VTEIKLDVPDISCDHCKMSIEGAVGKLAGVTTVAVSVDDRTVDVSFADSLTQADIVSAIEEQGYEVA
jgi:copper chaperone